MLERPINEVLIDKARALAKERYVEGRHHVFSALRTESGQIFLGAHVEAGVGRVAVCAEAVAIGAAATAGDTKIDTIVAVNKSGDIVSPCGMCRELVYDYAPNAFFILDDDGEHILVHVAELLPKRYQSDSTPLPHQVKVST